ncbi:S41 family peptidase [Streptomyces alkaliterrae]|uniref:PDZ domain-containing protein n=1 Tax=Streptomyces alkaliterrae TaxID=2213162 RepID=A0A5P0YQ37_9ACTN|nr:S41 family peptidase [Streptomyces alkaliterrae]MBB1262234.1 PDZ domain-containing protein [Streptomyces alkaliterrae]MQS00629.1 PDZ domain-containing protein [Streptomyces alkaliterrae]
MSGTRMFVEPRRMRRGAALTFVFAGVLLTGFATGSWSEEAEGGEAAGPRGTQGTPISPSGAADPAVEDVHQANDAHKLVSRSGDRWSAAYSAREYEGLQQALDGRYVGVGIAVRRASGGALEVARVTAGSPADRAGVRRGDRLRAVDGEDVRELPVTDVVARLRGDDGERAAPGGSTVTVDVGRDGRARAVTLRRASLSTEPVTVERLTADTTRIKVTAFTKGSGDEVRRAVRRVPEGSGVLLDLRGNAGGLLHEATAAAAAFLDGGLVGTYGDQEKEHALHAEPGGQTTAPLVVLVDGGSMSAAELVAGALQDRDRAVVVGSRTFGKGTVQMPREQPDGSVAELTVGHYTTPSGRVLDGEGLTPDVTVRPGERALDKARTVLSGLAARD